jgi:hypothetical protein
VDVHVFHNSCPCPRGKAKWLVESHFQRLHAGQLLVKSTIHAFNSLPTTYWVGVPDYNNSSL